MGKQSPLDSVLGRLDDLDNSSLTTLVKRLARERRLLETIVNTVREGILVLDVKGRIEYANAAALSLLAIAPREVGRAILWKKVPDLARSLDLAGRSSFGGLSGLTREVAINYPDKRILRLYITPFPQDGDEDEEASRFAVILSDVTEEKASTDERIESEKVESIRQLAAGVAHELGNPLNSLTIHLQLLERSVGQPARSVTGARLPVADKAQRSLAICRREVERLDGIIRHFLEAVRPAKPDMGDLNLFRVLEESLEFVTPEMADAGLQIEVDIDDRLPPVIGDRNQIKQVFYNLIKNAREATPSGGQIKIRSRTDDEFVYLLFGDTGSGIKAEDLAKVFQPYFTTKTGGHGLGMMVVQRIMRDHGGQVGIDSRPGLGTVVTLSFPQKHRRVRLLQSGDS